MQFSCHFLSAVKARLLRTGILRDIENAHKFSAGAGIVTAAGAARPAKPLPIVFGYIVAAQFFRLMIDRALAPTQVA